MDGKIDFAINFVSLYKIGQSSDAVMIARLDILNNIQSREEDILSLFILGHCRDVGLKNFYNMFTILRGLSAYTSTAKRTQRTFAVPRAKNSRTTLLPSLVCTISASKSLQLHASERLGDAKE
jgi:hypothetical protein